MSHKIGAGPLIREVPPTSWYFRHPRYLRYMAREITSLFIGAYCVLLVFGLGSLAAGEASYEAFLLTLRSPASIAFHVLALVAALYHAATWFNATQKAMPIQLGEEFVPGNLISGAHYVAWAVLSIAILFLAGVF
jgi:fumarate reductase subunit C